ncbi:hypothetical protein AAFX91_36955 [Bradyrhizobium sp. 31Argb]|uniref:hypothetical protein n=1 Tax=Bradyrhizobium sp. 31Argb TaxID=3141247 RepID=UPI003749EE62
MSADTETAATRPMTFADQVALVDVDAVATRIASSGPRFAIQASTIEIIAMAVLIGRLRTIADLTYDMLAFADIVTAQRDRDTRAALMSELSKKISVLGAALEALGYGQPTSPAPEEK